MPVVPQLYFQSLPGHKMIVAVLTEHKGSSPQMEAAPLSC